MSEYKIASKGKLSFKGEKSSKKKKKRKSEEAFEEEGQQEGWIFAQTMSDLVGPLCLIFNSEPLCCLHMSEKDRSINIQPLQNQNLATVEPENVNSVFVGAQIIGNPDHISLKTCDGKYLSSDKFGIITADKEAIGPQEEWTPIIREDGIALQNSYDCFLSADEIADGGYKLRADAETIGFCETWRLKCQARFRKKQKTTKIEDKPARDFEIEQIKKYQTWGGGRVRTTEEGTSELKKAKKEGNFNEVLLDRREKVKADRYCK
ncbi:8028_t:CDS:2 [Ambispora gerdemannii]|uniref:8028_t:CDS:1 n=1 Tax=Ambispora gerdemannii TaxID=144530 RepID=A0A9N8V3H6_9GLOM|nr:8028_t:CDS:2 [Ambispora gerdemannii]